MTDLRSSTRRPQPDWRLLRHHAAEGAENMAIDEAIGESVAAREAAPTIRFFAWEPPCVSLGRGQPVASIDVQRCEARGYQIVRRPTGGRAILHADELTYSVVAPADHPLMQGAVLDVYLRLAAGLVAGLVRLGIAADTAPGSNRAGPDASAACFEVPSAYEIVVEGRKLLGSAQNRRAGYVLQHGSLPLGGDLTRLVDCLAVESEREREALRASLAAHSVTAEDAAGRPIGFVEATEALELGLSSALGIRLPRGEMTDAERSRAATLVREKYGNTAWTLRS